MGIKISELPLGTANANAIVPATNAAGTLTEKIKLSDIVNLKKDWEVASFSANSFTATSGRNYYLPPTDSIEASGFDIVDPASSLNGEWYFFWNQSMQPVRVGGVLIPKNQIVARYCEQAGPGAGTWHTVRVNGNPFDQNLNAADSPQFKNLTVDCTLGDGAGGGFLRSWHGSNDIGTTITSGGVTFPDDTIQTTAAINLFEAGDGIGSIQPIGGNNQVLGNYNVIGGGFANEVSGNNNFIGGGLYNNIAGIESVIVGGQGNDAAGRSTIGGGVDNNAASGGAITGGRQNSASGYGSVCGGAGNTASGAYSFVGGGGALGSGGNSATGLRSTVGGGLANAASGPYSSVLGGIGAAATHYGSQAHSSGGFVAVGDAQTISAILRNHTTDATPTNLFLDGISECLVIPNYTAWTFSAQIVATNRSSTAAAGWQIRGAIRNNNNSAAFVGSVISEGWSDSDFASATVTMSVDNGVDSKLNIQVVGISGAVRWVASVEITQVSFVPIFGCIDPGSLNYNSSADTDDGSCCYVSGCTDPNSEFYNPNACVDDSSCVHGGNYGMLPSITPKLRNKDG